MTFKHLFITCLLLSAVVSACGCKESAHTPASWPAVSASCATHGLPSADCPFCNPDQVRKLGMCAEHGVPEALCWICRPALLASFRKQNDWCAGHDRPESLCFICNREREAIYADMFAAMPSSGTGDGHDHSHGEDHGHDDDGHDHAGHDHAHDHAGHDHAGHNHAAHASNDTQTDHGNLVPRAQRAPSVSCTTSDMRIRLESADVARSAGFKFAKIDEQTLSQVLECNAEIAYDANRYSRVASRVAGVIQSVEKDVGDMVQAGEVLAIVDSAELASAKAEYLQASETKKLWEKNHAATHELVERGIASSQEDLAAENKLAEAGIQLSKAIQHLRVLGLSAERIAGIESENDIGPLLPIAAPFDGEIVERTAVMGETVETTRPLFTVADTRKMWALLDVYERDIARVQIGQPVVVTLDGIPGEKFGGKVVWISRQIDPRTRTLHVRAELDNAGGQLRANMFGRARITIQPRAALPAVPRDAVQWDGCCNVAFVQVSASEYQPRKLRLGIESGDYFEIREGLSIGDTIVTQGSFMLKTELMKSSIGAGCCEARH